MKKEGNGFLSTIILTAVYYGGMVLLSLFSKEVMPEGIEYKIVYEALALLWPLYLVFVSRQGQIFKPWYFFSSLDAGLAFFGFYLFLIVNQVIRLGFHASGLPLVCGILTLVGAAVREEVIFRGAVLNIMLQRHGKGSAGVWMCLIWSALLYGAMDLTALLEGASPESALCSFACSAMTGVLFGAIYLRGHSLWVVMILHLMVLTAASYGPVFASAAPALPSVMTDVTLETVLYTAVIILLPAFWILRPYQMRWIVSRKRWRKKKIVKA